MKKASSAVVKTNSYLLNISIVAGLLSGLVLTLNPLSVKILLTKYKFPGLQLNFDTNLCTFILYLPMFLYDKYVNGMVYEGYDVIYMTGAQFCGSFGMVLLTLALQRGKGGIVQAIENLKVPW